MMEDVRKMLDGWAISLPPPISVGGLISRSETAHKWKSTYRLLMLREALFCRMQDLMEQAYFLNAHDHVLGARILARSALETLALFTYLNQKVQGVIDGSYSFFDFSKLTKQLLLGTKNDPTSPPALNILTALKKADTYYAGIETMHAALSESAHPNFDGVLFGYSKSNNDTYETRFGNFWKENFQGQMEPVFVFAISGYTNEYTACGELIEELEKWLEVNSDFLEQEKLKYPEPL